MVKQNPGDHERFEELKADQALFGLSEEEQAELLELSRMFPDEELDDLDRTAATTYSTIRESKRHSIPDELRKALKDQARKYVGSNVPRPSPRADKGAWRNWLPWLITAASLAGVVAALFVDRTPQLTAAQLRAKLVADANDLVEVSWIPGSTPIEGAAGDVVWSETRQEGYMRFRNLPVNLPTKEQYQLWIFAENQSAETPIDGGVFDITSQQETVVPIEAKLNADNVYMFAVTMEKPGGVVVSSRERLPLLAKVE